ncbi:MAG: alpha-1,2-fucosyltransferase [Cyclobacteriaceae bacterium]
MIVVDLIGGLGNQLFQYAAGRSLANKHQAELKVYSGRFQTYTLHKYSLHHFNISAPILTDIEAKNYVGLTTTILNRFSLKPYYNRKIYKERFFHYDENFTKASKDVMLSGYWQSEKYFPDIRSVLLNEFSIKTPVDELNRRFVNDIEAVNSVSLHIRRGDYISDAKANRVHGACDEKYYNTCIREIGRLVKDPVFYIFSDEPEWAKRNMKMDYQFHVVDHNNADKNYEDLRLMSLCKHNIIANSSFSWWGAWLNLNPHKYVFAPRNWFATPARNGNDVVPSDWIKV